jgi:hypothetical protein
VYYDSRDDPATPRVNTHVSVSDNGGIDWTDVKVSNADWDGDPAPINGEAWAGDYIGVVAKGGLAYPVWSDDREIPDSFRAYCSPLFAGGVESASITAIVSQNCAGVGNPRVRFEVDWSTLVGTEVDSLVVTAPTTPNPTTYGCEKTNQGTSHQLVLYDLPCVGGTWTYRIVSKKGPAISRPGPMTKQITCISCPPPCHPPCELE